MTRPVSVDAVPSSRGARRWRLTGGVAMAATLQPALSWAAGGGGHGEAHHVPSIGDLLFPAINFSIYLAIVIVYLIPAIRQYLRQRHAQIVAAVDEAKQALADAEDAAAKARTRLGAIDTECAALRDDLVNAAAQHGERIRAEARTTGERRLNDARVLAEQERRRALGNVRAEIAALATSLAEARIRKALGPDDQRTFVQQFLRETAGR